MHTQIFISVIGLYFFQSWGFIQQIYKYSKQILVVKQARRLKLHSTIRNLGVKELNIMYLRGKYNLVICLVMSFSFLPKSNESFCSFWSNFSIGINSSGLSYNCSMFELNLLIPSALRSSASDN